MSHSTLSCYPTYRVFHVEGKSRDRKPTNQDILSFFSRFSSSAAFVTSMQSTLNKAVQTIKKTFKPGTDGAPAADTPISIASIAIDPSEIRRWEHSHSDGLIDIFTGSLPCYDGRGGLPRYWYLLQMVCVCFL